jgi:hypothetical protein
MAIPDYLTIMAPIMNCFSSKETLSLPECTELVANLFKLTKEEREQMQQGADQTTVYNRTAWALVHLAKAGLLRRPGRGAYSITRRGTDVITASPNIITLNMLKEFPEYREFLAKKGEKSKSESIARLYPDESGANEAETTEGAKRLVFVNVYERSPEARKMCLEDYGTTCFICGFDAAEIYGKRFKGKIHVHHLIPLSEIGVEYIVNPIDDLRPVCPNCHMVLHSKKDGCYSIDEVKAMLNGS